MNTLDAILKRRSIRDFKDIEVNDQDIEKLLIAAMAAPSAKNMRPWEFYVIKDKEIQDKIKKVSPYTDKNSPLIIVCAGRAKTLNNTLDELNGFWIHDVSAAIENILLEATELGLGSLWCGLFPHLDRSSLVKEILNLEDDVHPLGLIHIGYANEIKEERTQYEESKVHYI